MSRLGMATALGFREQARRPLLAVLLVVTPFVLITRAIARTEPLPRVVPLPGGGSVVTNMRDIHGANMAAITVAFLAGLVGVFVVQSSREADRRLVAAGFRSREVIAPRLLVIAASVGVVLLVSLAVTALGFAPRQWMPFAAGNLLVGVTYAGLGVIAGGTVGRLGATYLLMLGAMLDLGVVQNPMFGSARPPDWGRLLPGYGPTRVLLDGAFSERFHASPELMLGLAWVAGVALLVAALLRRNLRIDSSG